MTTIPVLFWLTIIIVGHEFTTTVYPIPFPVYDDCISAGKTVTDAVVARSYYSNAIIVACPMQRQSDVTGFHSIPYKGRE